MPRTSKVESSPCPPLRVLTADLLGLVKVVECRGNAGTSKLVETWGSIDVSRGIVAGSFFDDRVHPLFAIGRKDGSVELRNPLNGNVVKSFLLHEVCSEGQIAKDDAIAGLHVFRKNEPEVSSKMGTLLVCTENRKAFLASFKLGDVSEDFSFVNSPNVWDVCAKGKVQCSSLSGDQRHALFAGKGVEVNVWDLDGCQKTWASKPPAANNLGIFTPTWFTATTFLNKNDSKKIVAGTSNHQIRLYDISAQRRPVISVDFRESSIRSLAADLDGNVVYVGTGAGDLASFDMRTGKLLGCFIGKCSGSIRSIARHPDIPVIASCGLDGYLRLWDAGTRQPLSAVFLKQQLTHLAFDPSFSGEEVSAGGIGDDGMQSEVDDLEETLASDDSRKADRSKAGKKRSDSSDRPKMIKLKKKRKPRSDDHDDDDDES
ncbi:transducin/WD40 repeat-like superfamily protein [Wolffia australiana]